MVITLCFHLETIKGTRFSQLVVFLFSFTRITYYRKRGSASYIVREVLSVRERERDTEREIETEVTSPFSR